MTELEDVTLVCVDCINPGLAINSLQKSLLQIKPERCLLLTDKEIEVDGIEVVKILPIKSKDEYSRFIVKQLHNYIETGHVLITQHDSWVLDGSLFPTSLYEYDYAGALWLENDGLSNGNGGFSWRSIELLINTAKDDFIKATTPEDVALCRVYRNYLESEYHLKWAPDDVCEQFSFELREPNQKTFGFHGYFHQPFRHTIILKRSGAMGDIIMMEPLMRWYYDNGYNVVVDIPNECCDLFAQHYFPVKHISQFDKGRIPAMEINLDLAYEVKPKQSYIQSYFDMCGIKEKPQFKPYLYPYVDEQTKLFKKYCVVHIDKRETPHRNIFDVNWKKVERHLTALGYTVVQVGKAEHESIGIEMNAMTIGFLKFVISGADLFIGIDSGPSHIAVAYNIPSVIFFGSVNPDYIHPDLSRIEAIQGKCDRQHCWHIVGGTAGQPCFYDAQKPPCCVHDSDEVIDAINKFHQR